MVNKATQENKKKTNKQTNTPVKYSNIYIVLYIKPLPKTNQILKVFLRPNSKYVISNKAIYLSNISFQRFDINNLKKKTLKLIISY